MRSIIDILGGAQQLLDIDFKIDKLFEEILTEEYKAFIAILRIIPIDRFVRDKDRGFKGRPQMSREAMFRSFLLKSFLRIDTTTSLINRLKSDSNLRLICCFGNHVPDESTFSRAFAEFSVNDPAGRILDELVKENIGDKLIGHISRDSTAIESREKPFNKKRDMKESEKKQKRGRPRKGEKRVEKEMKRLKKQLKQKPGKAISELDLRAAWGCKKNSQGNVMFWKGYKLHLDVTDFGMPVTAIVTGANVHDSQTAIPMEKLTSRKITHLYSLMDAAYDSEDITGFICNSGRVPLIDPNKRRKQARCFSPSEKNRFKIRSTVERANANLKDWLLGGKMMVKGYKKVKYHLLCGVICLSAIKVLQYIRLPEQDKLAA
jgi:transposase